VRGRGHPRGFGTGKTVTQHQLSKWCEADLIVYVGCGERGNEMTGILTELPALQDPRTGHPLLERTILIAITQTLDLAWQILKELPRGDLTRVTSAEIEQFGGWDQGQ
jgi:vacuolar-type H+-ATPase catalytic subunit A/Vma1